MWHTIILVGNVGKDPMMRFTPNGQPVTTFSMAVNRQYTSNGQQVKETLWFTITTWNKQAEVCNQYLKKGSKVLVEGRLTGDKQTGGPRLWQRQDNTMGSNFEVTASVVRFLSRVEEGQGAPHEVASDIPAGEEIELPVDGSNEDGVPF